MKRNIGKRLGITCLGFVLAACLLPFVGIAGEPAAPGKPLLHPLFSDEAVLQRGKPVAIWGWAAPGAEVTVQLAGNGLIAKPTTTCSPPAGGTPQGGYAAPPRGGTAQGETSGVGIEGMAITFPALTLRLPSLQLPACTRWRRDARMILNEAEAPFQEIVNNTLTEIPGLNASPPASGVPQQSPPGGQTPTPPGGQTPNCSSQAPQPGCGVPAPCAPNCAVPNMPVPPPPYTTSNFQMQAVPVVYQQPAPAESVYAFSPRSVEQSLAERAAELDARSAALQRKREQLELQARAVELDARDAALRQMQQQLELQACAIERQAQQLQQVTASIERAQRQSAQENNNVARSGEGPSDQSLDWMNAGPAPEAERAHNAQSTPPSKPAQSTGMKRLSELFR